MRAASRACRRAPWLLRACFAVGLMALLGGPTPGAVGACGGDQLDEPADLQAYCTERDQLVCVRRSLRKELSYAERDDCRRLAIAQCPDRFWLPECQPTRRQARACLNALRSFDTLHTREDEIEECSPSRLCGIYVPDAGTPRDAAATDLDGGLESEGN
jgi:hypothetical protein